MKPVRDPQPTLLLGARLRNLRKQTKLTQQAVADRLNIHRTTYNKYEAGTVAPDQQGLVRLSEIFGVSVGFLLGCETESSAPLVADREEQETILTLQEKILVQMFRQLSMEEQKKLVSDAQKVFNQRREMK